MNTKLAELSEQRAQLTTKILGLLDERDEVTRQIFIEMDALNITTFWANSADKGNQN